MYHHVLEKDWDWVNRYQQFKILFHSIHTKFGQDDIKIFMIFNCKETFDISNGVATAMQSRACHTMQTGSEP